jgi:hypothetical protein
MICRFNYNFERQHIFTVFFPKSFQSKTQTTYSKVLHTPYNVVATAKPPRRLAQCLQKRQNREM